MVAILAVLLAASIFFRRTLVFHHRHSRSTAVAPPQEPQAPALGEVGLRLPELKLTDISGHPLHPEELRGKVLLLDYWAPWCMPCEREMPGYQHLQDKYRDRGLLVIGIVFDPGMPMGDEAAGHFAKRVHIRYTLVQDSPNLQKQFGGIQGVPTTFLIGRDGFIRYKVVGFEYTATIEKALQPLL